MAAPDAVPALVHRTATVRLRLTRRQARRCYGLLRSAGDVWAWLLDTNRQRHQQGERLVNGYHALCRELAKSDGFGELSTVGARSVLRRYSDAWFHAAKRRRAGQRLRQWRRTHLLHALHDKAEQAGLAVRLVDERGTSSTLPRLSATGSETHGPPVPLPLLHVLRASGSGRCRQHRRQGRRRTHTRWGADACRAPSRRHGAGTA
jgi:hypothetical protein